VVIEASPTAPASPPLNGWTLIAILHHCPGRPTAVETIGAVDIDTDAWSRSEGWCEHCRTRRARTTTYLLRDARGRLAQVGANCLADFTGHPHPLDALGHGRPRGSAHRALRRRSPRTVGRTVEYIDTRTYLAHVAQAILDTGFVPAAAGTRERPATWVQASLQLEHGHPPSERADRRACEALAWARENLALRKEIDNFQRRLVAVLAQDRLTRRELATAAAAVHSYHGELRRQIAARQRLGEHIGGPGETVTASFRLRRATRVATAAGPVNRHFLVDEFGRLAMWDSRERVLAPGHHRVRVTVARHVHVGERPLTILSSCDDA
jgi:hypothetical protein